MLPFLLVLLCCAYLPSVVHGSCDEKNGSDGSKVLTAPCSFTQLAGKKNWETTNLQKSTDVFFRFEMMNCENYKESNGKITLTCSHSDSFYIMKRVLSFGAKSKARFIFEFKPSSEMTYNNTKIVISGKLSTQLNGANIQATKEAGNADFEFSTNPIPMMNMVEFMKQRMTVAGRDLQSDFYNAIKNPATNCIMSGIFSALNDNPDKPESQDFELLINNGAGNEFYIIQNMVADDRYIIAFYKENVNSKEKQPRLYIRNQLHVPFLIPQGFSPVFDADASAYGISEDLIVNINNAKFRDMAQKYVSQSSKGLILQGGNLYWHIDDPQKIKTLAKDVPTVEEPPTPTNETSALHTSKGKLKAAKKVKRDTMGSDQNNYSPEDKAQETPSNIAKRSEEPDFTKRNQKIALNANFDNFESEKIIEISSPEYLKGELDKVLQTFMPNHDIPAAASKLKKLQVVFDRIVLHIPAKEEEAKTMSVYCNISQNFDLVQNLISGDGITVIAETKLTTSVPQAKQQWIIKGQGRTEVLEQLIDVQLGIDDKDQLLVKGIFEIANMTEFWNASGKVNYLPKEYRTAYPHLTNFALTKLNLKSVVGGHKLRIIGKCLLFSQPKTDALVAVERREGIEDNNLNDLVLPSKVRIIMTNDSSVKYVVGIVGEDIPFEEAIMQLFKKSVSGASWVKFRKIGVILSNADGAENEFDDSFLKKLPIKAGIQSRADLLIPKEEDCKIIQTLKTIVGGSDEPVSSDDNPRIMIDSTCMFIKDRPTLVGFFGNAIGKINTKKYSFQSKIKHRKFFKLSPESTNPIEIKKPKYYLGPSSNDDKESATFRIDGIFNILFNGNTLQCKGSIEFDELKGKLMMTLDGLKKRRSDFNDALPFSIEKMKGGYSVLSSDGEFRRFITQSVISIGLKEDYLVKFGRSPQMIFDVMDSKKFYVKGYAYNYKNNPNKRRNILWQIMKAFNSKLDKYILFKDFASDSMTGVIYSAADEDFTVKYFEEFKFKKGLNIYGTIKLLDMPRRKYHFHYDSATSKLTLEVNLPPIRLPRGSSKPLFILGKGPHYKNQGGHLMATEDNQKTQVKFVGYLQAIGVEMPVRFEIMQGGQFKIDLHQMASKKGEIFKLFDQAPCTMTIEQQGAVTDIKMIDPVINLDFAPATNSLVRATRDFVKSIIKNIKTYEKSKLTKFMRVVGTGGRNLRQLSLDLNKQLEKSIKKIEKVKKRLGDDCVEKCESQRMTVFGYKLKKGKTTADNDRFEVANVLCIAECEMVKPLSVSTQESILDKIEKLKEEFEDVTKRSALMEKLLDLHFVHLKEVGHQRNRAVRRAALKVENVHKKIKLGDEIPFSLVSLLFQKRLSQIQLKGNGSKCIVGIESEFNYIGDKAKRTLNICFNGEYEHYTAKEILNNYYQSEKRTLFRFQKNMNEAAEAQEEIELVLDDVIDLFEKVADPNFEYKKLLDLIESTAWIDSKGGNRRKRAQIAMRNKKLNLETPFKNYISYGKYNISIPTILPEVESLLKEDFHYSLKSPKSKRVFLYSSPWAALNNLGVHRNESFTNFAQSTPNDIHQGSYCKRLEEVSSVFDKIRRSLSNYAMSYVYAKRQLGDTNTILKKGLEELTATVDYSVNYKLNKGQHNGFMFWYNQYKKGVNMYDTLVKEKLEKHNNNGLKGWKQDVENSLKKNGVASLDDFLETFQSEAKNPAARSNIANKDNGLVENVTALCKDMSSLLKNSNIKLDQANTAIDNISKSFDVIKPKIPSCNSS